MGKDSDKKIAQSDSVLLGNSPAVQEVDGLHVPGCLEWLYGGVYAFDKYCRDTIKSIDSFIDQMAVLEQCLSEEWAKDGFLKNLEYTKNRLLENAEAYKTAYPELEILGEVGVVNSAVGISELAYKDVVRALLRLHNTVQWFCSLSQRVLDSDSKLPLNTSEF